MKTVNYWQVQSFLSNIWSYVYDIWSYKKLNDTEPIPFVDFVWFFFLRVFRPTREFFTHMETSPLPLKGWKFLPMLGHWAVRVLQRVTPNGHLRGPVTLTPIADCLVVHCHYLFKVCRSWFELPTLRLRGVRSNRLRHRRGPFVEEIGWTLKYKFYSMSRFEVQN